MSKKEQQIEELAREIEKRLECAKNVIGSMNKGKGYWIAEDLINKNYRKVSEKPTVIDGFKTDYAYRQMHAKKMVDEVRKQTAKEILQRLYDTCYERQKANGGVACDVIPIDILALAEEYGVEIEE